jgi:predicted glycosyltransferase
LRSVLFCNEMLGLCHLRMSVSLAEGLVGAEPGSSALVVTGSPESATITAGAGVDVVKLPSAPVGAESKWSLTGRRSPTALAAEAGRVRELRSAISLATVSTFEPDVVVVDYKPVGRDGDLRAALEWCRGRRGVTKVLGLWDVDDAPERLREAWTQALLSEVSALYDLAFVYGTPAGDDVRIERLTEAGVPVHITGRLGAAAAPGPSDDLGSGYLLAVAGGGADGLELMTVLLDAIRQKPIDAPTVIVTGPMMDAADLLTICERATGLDVRVERLRADMPAVTAGARAIVGMGGYSTITELLAAGKPAVLAPRAFPRAEQINRARRLAAAGRIEMLEPDDLTPALLAGALARVLAQSEFAPEPPTGALDAVGILEEIRAYA